MQFYISVIHCSSQKTKARMRTSFVSFKQMFVSRKPTCSLIFNCLVPFHTALTGPSREKDQSVKKDSLMIMLHKSPILSYPAVRFLSWKQLLSKGKPKGQPEVLVFGTQGWFFKHRFTNFTFAWGQGKRESCWSNSGMTTCDRQQFTSHKDNYSSKGGIHFPDTYFLLK